MTTYTIPHDLLPADSATPTGVLVRSYVSRQNTVKNKIILSWNMLNLLLDGRKTIIQATGAVTVYQDEILLLAAGNCLTSELLSDAGQFRSILVYFSNQVLDDFLVRHAALLHQPGSSGPGAPLVTFAKDDFIRNYTESLRLLLAAPAPPSPEIWQLKLDELLLYLLHTNPEGLRSFQRHPRTSPPELTLRQVVETHLARPVTVEELAFLCHMSVSTFQRKFAGIYGQSPQKWLLHQRMQRAASLLHQHQPPSDVYQQVGYESHSSFSEAFRKTFGVSPREFKQQLIVG